MHQKTNRFSSTQKYQTSGLAIVSQRDANISQGIVGTCLVIFHYHFYKTTALSRAERLL